MLSKLLPVLALTPSLLAAPTPSSSEDPSCPKTLLRNITAAYVSAQTGGQPSTLTTTFGGSSITYTENFKTADITKGILTKPQVIDHQRSQHDTTNCATYTELIITDTKHPYVLGTQIHLTAGKVSKIETIVTEKGDWLFNAANTLKYAKQETWDAIPESARDTRAVIQAAADAYCDIFKDKSVKVPWGKPCERLEGGSYTGKGSPDDSCDVGIPNNVVLSDRRYVVDEEYGTVDVFLSFQGIADTHEFRVEKGKIRYVHTMTDTGK